MIYVSIPAHVFATVSQHPPDPSHLPLEAAYGPGGEGSNSGPDELSDACAVVAEYGEAALTVLYAGGSVEVVVEPNGDMYVECGWSATGECVAIPNIAGDMYEVPAD